MEKTALDLAWKELEPAVHEIEQLVMTAPLSESDKARLAAYVAARTFGMVAAAIGLTPNDVEEIAAYIGNGARQLGVSN